MGQACTHPQRHGLSPRRLAWPAGLQRGGRHQQCAGYGRGRAHRGRGRASPAAHASRAHAGDLAHARGAIACSIVCPPAGRQPCWMRKAAPMPSSPAFRTGAGPGRAATASCIGCWPCAGLGKGSGYLARADSGARARPPMPTAPRSTPASATASCIFVCSRTFPRPIPPALSGVRGQHCRVCGAHRRAVDAGGQFVESGAWRLAS